MCCWRMCGVEVLLGYCCDKPRELWSRSASPAPPSSQSTGTIWRAVPGDANALRGSAQALTAGMGSVCACCPRAIPACELHLSTAGERFKGSKSSLHQLF